MTQKALKALLRAKQGIRLDLGCGAHKQEGGFLGIDKRKTPAVDLVHDLERFPWPLPESCASLVVISHFWEHVKPWLTLDFMAELHRVCQPGAQVMISGPYAMGFRYCQDPTHCNPTNEATFAYFDPRHPLYEVYSSPATFHLLAFEVVPAGIDKDFNAILQAVKP